MTSKTVKIGLIQMANKLPAESSCKEHVKAMIDAHIPYIEEAAGKKVQMLCFQEMFTGPYFCPSQDTKWYDLAEPIPDGHTTQLMCNFAKKYNMVIIVPIYEMEMTGVYYNTASVIDADGKYLGKYRKNHIPQVKGFWEKFFFRPGNLGYPVFKTKYGSIGVYLCYDRHFPDGARCLGLNGAEIVFNPSATVAGLSEYIWKVEQPAHAVANGYFVCAINRVGTEAPWNIGEFYGSSYIVNPKGQILVQASRNKDELLVCDINMDEIKEARDLWQFYRDRRPETYKELVAL
ncbi:MAG: acyltransferase [Candidatus Melainabacteria bacterium RIFCSPLOWO2_02_FULL_35_15]|nr:MAG: acyltransferase [Candidatus Melainabacteria bacterium RIFCSPLOWO2_12_FULL_35_11]OGI14029.1 MAG: acyltransferase [Candidatus Melainabacteria bacterium RIFCSPLOWO2_02_FULL_35_15]